MEIKYHINKKNEKRECHAEKRACRYKTHSIEGGPSNSPTDAESLQTLMNKVNIEVTPPSLLKEPTAIPSSRIYDIFTFESAYYDEPVNVIESVDVRNLLAAVHNVDPSFISDDYVKYAEDNKWDTTDNFISEETGYYGEGTVDVELTPDLVQKMQEHYYTRPDAVDRTGVLAYCRSKGFDTTGKNPVEALKSQIRAENNNKAYSPVDNATKVNLQTIRLDSVIIPAKQHYEAVEPRPLDVKPAGDQAIAGVVVKTRDGGYRLVDGYHRTKFLNNSTKRSKGIYFVLS
jgi:hypothetical protein